MSQSLNRFLILWGFDKERENYRSICYLYLLLPIEGHYWGLEPFPRYNRLKEGKQLDWLPILLSGIAGPYKFIHPLLSNNQLHVFPRLNENSTPSFLVALFSLISFHLADLALLLTNYLVHHLCVKWVNPSCTFHLLIMSRNTRFRHFIQEALKLYLLYCNPL